MRGQVDAAVYGIVILVGGGRRWGSQAFLVLIHVRVVNQRDVVGVVIDQKLGRRHEVMDGGLGFWFLQAFVEGATERFHHPNLEGDGGGKGGEGEEGRRKETMSSQLALPVMPTSMAGVTA